MLIAPISRDVLEILHRLLEPTQAQWLLGGSMGLMLRGLPCIQQPRDIDIYIDHKDSARVHEALHAFASHPPRFSETDMYESTLCHYYVLGVQVEVVCDFRVQTLSCLYQVEVAVLATYFQEFAKLDESVNIPVIPLAHELLFNLLRQRSDRYVLIASWIELNPKLHVPALTYLLHIHTWSDEILQKVNEYVNIAHRG